MIVQFDPIDLNVFDEVPENLQTVIDNPGFHKYTQMDGAIRSFGVTKYNGDGEYELFAVILPGFNKYHAKEWKRFLDKATKHYNARRVLTLSGFRENIKWHEFFGFKPLHTDKETIWVK